MQWDTVTCIAWAYDPNAPVVSAKSFVVRVDIMNEQAIDEHLVSTSHSFIHRVHNNVGSPHTRNEGKEYVVREAEDISFSRRAVRSGK